MKRLKHLTARLCIAAVLFLLLAGTAFAFTGSLKVINITPKNGEKGKQPENMAVKITFSENMIDEAAVKTNENKFKIKDPEGNLQKFKLTYNAAKYPNELWLILEESLASDTEYTVEILSGIVSASGSTLREGLSTTFKTRNVKTDQTVSMLLMFGMMGFMFFATTMSAKKEAQKEGLAAGKAMDEDNLNPYKIARERNISFEEAAAYVEKEKAKIEKKRQKLEKQKRKTSEEKTEEMEKLRQEILEEMRQEALAEGRFFVSAPRSLRKEGKRIPRSVINRNKRKRASEKTAQKQALRNKRRRK